MTRRGLTVLSVLLVALIAPPASAQRKVGPAALQLPPQVDIETAPLLGSLPSQGWSEILVRIDNGSKQTWSGQVEVRGEAPIWAFGMASSTTASFSVASGAVANLRIVHRGMRGAGLSTVLVYDADGQLRFRQKLSTDDAGDIVLLDVSRTSILKTALDGVAVPTRYNPWAAGSLGSPVRTVNPIYDSVSGEPLLPRQAASYGRIAAVLIRSADLVRLAAREREALATWLLGGGTLAVFISRPEDLRATVLVSLCGAKLIPSPAEGPMLDPVTTPPPPPGSALGGPPPRKLSSRPPLDEDLRERLQGHSGGNLRPTLFGASAPYGLGRVHILSFDPQTKPAVDAGWAHVRMVELLRRATERVPTGVFRPGASVSAGSDEVRRTLDPNDAHWAIPVSSILLLLYAAAAGPLNFRFWRKRGRPSRAWLYLPLYSASAFGAVVAVGTFAKGCDGRAYRLTVVDAGAGMKLGTAYRYRGYYLPKAKRLTATGSRAAGVLGRTSSGDDEVAEKIQIDRDGSLRLTDIDVVPWEMALLREDTLVPVGGEGISLVNRGGGTALVVNRTGRNLEGLLLHLPTGSDHYAERLADGASLSSDDMPAVSASAPRAEGGFRLTPYNLYSFMGAESRHARTWQALHSVRSDDETNWFPDGVPTLLATVEGGSGAASDTGFPLGDDQLYIRVVGFGGTSPGGGH
ncbi:MAG: hypothetical protein AAGA56_02070 [Myxococcota bacterium]